MPGIDAPESPASPLQRRLPAVDTLRGVAIFLVLMNHVNMRLFLAKFPYWVRVPDFLRNALVWNGQNGVQIFFVVSGFLIMSISLRRWGAPCAVPVRNFYLMRAARIAPSLLLVLAMLSILHFAQVPAFIVTEKSGGLGRALIAALTFHVNWLEARRGYLPPSWDILWSLSIEETFYLCFPWVCRWCGRNGLVAILMVLVLLGPVARTILSRGNDTWREVSYLGGTDAIAMGCLSALYLNRLRSTCRGPGLQVAGGAGIAGVLLLPSETLVSLGMDMTILAFATCLVIVGTVSRPRRAFPMFGPLRALGRHSYEIYLTHMFVVIAAFELFRSLGMPASGVTSLFVVVVGLCAVVGGVMARHVSEPMNRLLRERWRAAEPLAEASDYTVSQSRR